MTGVAAHNGIAARPIILFVLGMSRSGTSALTRVLSLCGGTLPAALAGANSANPSGYWEPRKSLHLNAVILRRHGSAMIDPSLRLEEEGALDAKEQSAWIAEIRAYLNTLPAAPLIVIKDPQITALTGMWFEAARLAGFDSVAVIALRNPEEVTASVTANGPISQELSSALWLKFNLLAERHTRDVPRVFVEYPNLLEDWRREIKRISVALAIDLNSSDDRAIEEFLEDDLRRQRFCGLITEPFGTDWNSAVYEALSAAARDEPCDQPALDRIFEAYRATEFGFRRAHEDFRHNFKKPIYWPSLQRISMAVAALLHRRRGPWA